MSNFINHIYIRNFKSIRQCDVQGCKRINLFIGRPNVGKSNILEALSLFSIPYLRENSSKKLSNLVRLENEAELFYRGKWEQTAAIHTNIGECFLEFNPKESLKAIISVDDEVFEAIVDDALNVRALTSRNYDTRIKRYTYKQDVFYRRGHAKYLVPPFGYNLLAILNTHSELKEEVADFFREYGLKIVSDKASQTIKIIHSEHEEIFLIPYSSIADTLQRIIFYKAAIASNTNSVLLFEEPEAHSFPPYMTHLTQEMIYRKDNQYFIATHSPFILNDLLENAQDELAVFIVRYEDGETRLRPLNGDEMHQAFQNGVDLFTNSESFI